MTFSPLEQKVIMKQMSSRDFHSPISIQSSNNDDSGVYLLIGCLAYIVFIQPFFKDFPSRDSRLDVAINDESSREIVGSSTPIKCGRFFPKFFPTTVNLPSPILPFAREFQHGHPVTIYLPKAIPATCSMPSQFNHLPATPNTKAKVLALKLRKKNTQQGTLSKTDNYCGRP